MEKALWLEDSSDQLDNGPVRFRRERCLDIAEACCKGQVNMEPMNLTEIVAATTGQVISSQLALNPDKVRALGVSTDSRTLQPGQIFFALRGALFDGHSFVHQAISKGAAAAVVSSIWAQERASRGESQAVLIAVADPLRALQDLASSYRHRFDLTLIAVTGTNGKTTTKDMVAAVLASHFSTLKTEGNFNNQIGVPLTLLRIAGEHRMAVIEMGMSGQGEIRRSAQISRPRHGLITNIGPAHLLQMHSLEAITTAKFELLEMLPPDGLAFLNGDDERLRDQGIVPPSRTITFGMDTQVDYRATNIRPADEIGTEFNVIGLGRFLIPTWGRHNVYNALSAIAVGQEMGIEPEEIRGALKVFRPSPMRMERLEINGVTVMNDAYNANPASMKAALEVLSQIEARGRKVAVLGDMRELGKEELAAHREMGRLVASLPVDTLITVGQLAEEIHREALRSAFSASQAAHCSGFDQAAQKLKEILRPGDVVLLKGSRAVRLENILLLLQSESKKD